MSSLSAVSEGSRRGSSFRSLSGVAALSSARSSAALMSLRRESSGLLSCPVIIGSWRERRAQVGKREERIKKTQPWLDVLQRRRTLTGYFSLSPLTLSTQLSIAHSSLSLSLLLPPSPALSFIWGWCYPADTAGCSLVKKCYGWRGFTITPSSPKNGHISISESSLRPDIRLILSKHKADSSLQKRSTGCTRWIIEINIFLHLKTGTKTPVIISMFT